MKKLIEKIKKLKSNIFAKPKKKLDKDFSVLLKIGPIFLGRVKPAKNKKMSFVDLFSKIKSFFGNAWSRVSAAFAVIKNSAVLKKFGIIFRVAEYVAVFFLLLVVFVSFSPRFDFPGGFQSLVVLSGSMEPEIKTGSVVLVQPQESYAVGDVVTINKSLGEVEHVTHRIVEMEGEKVVTKGDANNAPDNWELTNRDIEGKVLFSAPYLGYAVNFAKTQRGFFLLVILPALLIVLNEVWEIKKEIEKGYEKRLAEALKDKGSSGRGVTTALFFFVLGFSVLVFSSSVTAALFTDTEKASVTITVTTDWDDEEPAPAKIVINEVYYDVVDDDSFCNEDQHEWIELYNSSDKEVPLKDWKLVNSQGEEKEIKTNAVALPGDSFVVLSHDESTWTQCWDLPDSDVDTIQWTGQGEWLDNDGDTLTLYNADGDKVDFVAWEQDGGEYGEWTIEAGDGESIARKEKGVDTDSVDDWEVLGDDEGEEPNPGTNPHSTASSKNDDSDSEKEPEEENATSPLPEEQTGEGDSGKISGEGEVSKEPDENSDQTDDVDDTDNAADTDGPNETDETDETDDANDDADIVDDTDDSDDSDEDDDSTKDDNSDDVDDAVVDDHGGGNDDDDGEEDLSFTEQKEATTSADPAETDEDE